VDATYLRIKNFADFQHYDPLKRTPPWIEQYTALLDDLDFLRLDEFTQRQLARIWLVAARSSSVTFDENQVVVPVVANDAQSLQRAISSVKKVPLAMLIRGGWLIPVDEEDLLSPAQIAAAPPRKKPRASKAAQPAADGGWDGFSDESDCNLAEHTNDVETLARRSHGASTTLDLSIEAEVSEVSEVSELDLASIPGRHSASELAPLGSGLADAIERARTASEQRSEGLPIEMEFQVGRLIRLIGDHADEGTRHVIERYAARLPQASLAKVIESLEFNHVEDRAAYAVGALRDEIAERNAA
jgi:hypothetical protein